MITVTQICSWIAERSLATNAATNALFPAAEDYEWIIDRLGEKPTYKQWRKALNRCFRSSAIVPSVFCSDYIAECFDVSPLSNDFCLYSFRSYGNIDIVTELLDKSCARELCSYLTGKYQTRVSCYVFIFQSWEWLFFFSTNRNSCESLLGGAI